MQEREIVLEVSNLSKKIGKSPIIKDVSFQLSQGEVLITKKTLPRIFIGGNAVISRLGMCLMLVVKFRTFLCLYQM